MSLFEALQLTNKKGAGLRSLPPIPETGWRPPSEFPNLDAATAISFDTETWDPELIEAGPGWARHRGHLVGISMAAIDNLGNRGSWYFPMRHRVEPEMNMDVNNVIAFASHYLGKADIPKIGANLLYDLGWCAEEGIPVRGELHDIQFAEALIDNNAFVGLDILGEKYLGQGKTTSLLYDWIDAAYNPSVTKRRANIYRSPPKLVGPYAVGDADLPIDILAKQWSALTANGLHPLYRLECDLLPLYIKMRMAGVSIDMGHAERLHKELETEIEQAYQGLEVRWGVRPKSTDSRALAVLLDAAGVEYPRGAPTPTKPKGNPSIRKEWLEALEHPVGEDIRHIREMEKIKGTFLESYIFQKTINGKLYCTFHPLKGESNGTAVGRFSSSDPNLQNIPSRTKLGKRVRQAFIPDPGHLCWEKDDYSQIHYRILAHNAIDRGDGSADALRQSYIENPDMDYHLKVFHEVAPFMGWNIHDPEEVKLRRRPIKNVNFGLLYGQGFSSLAYKAGMTKEQAEAFFIAYHSGAPYVKPTMEAIALEAEMNTYVTTLLGRRIRFEFYEPRTKDWDNPKPALRYEAALRAYGSNIKLAFTYRAVNYKFQGSEPDIMKTGLDRCHKSGVFDYVGVPRLTVHDELDFSVPDDSPTTREAFAFIKHTMESAIRLRVPVKVDQTRGSNWGLSD